MAASGDKRMPDGHVPVTAVSGSSGAYHAAYSGPPFPLLRLPREIRDIIVGEILFPGERAPEAFNQDRLGLARTAVRQIFPHDRTKKPLLKFDLAILRACRQLQEEGEAILYGTSSWNLMYQDWEKLDRVKYSYEFFEKLPKRNRRLIRRIERKCYSEPYSQSISLYDWKMFMTFLSRECPNLHSLRLWGPGDRREGPPWVASCRKDAEWVQAILHIKSLVEFDIPVIRGGIIYTYPEFNDDFLPWLKSSLLRQEPPAVASSLTPAFHLNEGVPFRFSDLPREIRDQIYQHVLLPPARQIHPYVKSWFDQSTQNVIPLFLTCKQIHFESELILFGKGVFTAPRRKYQVRLLNMLRTETNFGPPTDESEEQTILQSLDQQFGERQVALVRHVRMHMANFMRYPLLSCVARRLQLESIELVLGDALVSEMNRQWDRSAPENRAEWRGGFTDSLLRDVMRIPLVHVETSDRVNLHPGCMEWFTKGLREKFLSKSCNDPKEEWIHDNTFDRSELFNLDELARTRGLFYVDPDGVLMRQDHFDPTDESE